MKSDGNLKFWLCSLLIFASACSHSKADQELQQANQALENFASSSSLTKSCFYFLYPDGNAKDFVKYLFSGLGSAELPIALDEKEAEQMEEAGIVTLPSDVKISVNQRTYQDDKELVLIPQRANVVTVNGYLPEDDQPIFSHEWELDKVEIEQTTKFICESNLDLGIDIYQYN